MQSPADLPADQARRLLMDQVRDLALHAHFSRATLQAAELLASRSDMWRGPLAWFRPQGSAAYALQRQILTPGQLTEVVTVYLFPLFGRTALQSDCTCREPLCRHAAALLLRLQRFIDWPRALTPLERWQRSLGELAAPAAAAPAGPPDPRRLVGLIGTQVRREPVTLVARLVLIEAADGLLRPESWLAAERPEAEQCLTREGRAWLARLAREPEQPGEGRRLESADAAALLWEWLDAGICHDADTLRKLRRGPDRPPRWHWFHDEQAQARLAVQLSDSDAAACVELDGLHYLDRATGEIGRLSVTRGAWLMAQQMPPVPPTETALAARWPPHPLLEAIPPPPPSPPLRDWPASLQLTLVIGASRHTQRGDLVFHLHAWADYGGCRIPLGAEPWRERVVRRIAGEHAVIQRDLARELAGQQVLTQAGIVPLARLLPGARRTLVPAPDAQALLQRAHHQGGSATFEALEAALQSLAGAGFKVEHDPDLPFTLLPRETPLEAVLAPAQAPGFTQLQLTATVAGEAIDLLPVILRGLSRGAFSLTPAAREAPDACWLAPLGPERFLPLPLSRLREWLGPLVECFGRGEPTSLDLSRSQALALMDCLQRQEIAVNGPAAGQVGETLARLRAAQASTSQCPAPASFRGELRRYQREGLRWLQALRHSQLGGVLADDMGLGKTVQIIAHLLVEQEAGRLQHPALLVVPTSLVFNWIDELARFAPTLPCINFTGPGRAARLAELPGSPLILTTYALLPTELPALESLECSMLILDEAQWIKNPLTQTARAVRRLRATHRLAVTGTPLENHLGELWAHLDAVVPGLLGDYRTFHRTFRVPIERHQDDTRMALLRQRVAPFILRRTKDAVAPELPPKTETVLRVSMEEPQRRLYESLRLSLSEHVREALATCRTEQSRMVVLAALLRLRQVCCDPRLIGSLADPPASAKLDTLLGLIRSLHAAGRQVLVFSQFTSMLELISQALKAARLEHAVLTGATQDRAVPVRRFQQREVPILLASLKAGGVGLNLTAADAVIHYDPWWNPAVERQAVDRAHRLGREQPIMVYKLLCRQTIEEKVELMKADKGELAQALLGEMDLSAGPLSEETLRALLDLPQSA